MPLRLPASALLVAALLALWAPGTWARQGFYLGLGAAQQSVSGDLDGSHTFGQSGGGTVFFDGKLDGGDPGLEIQVGYGLNRILGLEFTRTVTKHSAESGQLKEKTDATFTSEFYGVRITAPFTDTFEGFLRAGYGVYEAGFDDFARTGVPLSNIQNVTFSGDGTAIGLGFEYYVGNWRWGLGHTMHSVTFHTAKAEGGRSLSLKKDLSASAGATALTLAYHFGTARN